MPRSSVGHEQHRPSLVHFMGLQEQTIQGTAWPPSYRHVVVWELTLKSIDITPQETCKRNSTTRPTFVDIENRNILWAKVYKIVEFSIATPTCCTLKSAQPGPCTNTMAERHLAMPTWANKGVTKVHCSLCVVVECQVTFCHGDQKAV